MKSLASLCKKDKLPNFIINPNPKKYMENDYVVLDFETTSYSHGDAGDRSNKLLLSVYSRSEGKNKVLWGNEYSVGEVVKTVESSGFLVAHNAKFELGWLKRAGADLSRILVFDTQIAEYTLHSNIRVPLSLDATSKRYNIGVKENLVNTLIHGGVNPLDIPGFLLEKYCIQDVDLTKELFLLQRERLKLAGLLGVQYTRCLFTPVLTEAELVGMWLDKDKVTQTLVKATEELRKLYQQLEEFAGTFNLNSPQQVGEILYDILKFKEVCGPNHKPLRGKVSKKFPEGVRKTDEPTLSQLKATNKKQKDFLQNLFKIRKLEKTISTYLNRFILVAGEQPLRGKFNQTVTATGRLSSSNPNLQNLEVDLKKLFCPRNPGYLIAEADHRQLEFRAAVFLGQDEIGKREIDNNYDIHAYSAHELGVSRYDAKPHTFKPLYGGTSGTPRQKAYYKAFIDKYQGISKTQRGWLLHVLKYQQLKTPTGMVFYFPGTRMTNTGYVVNTSKIYNYPIQYFATGEIVPIGITFLWHLFKVYKKESFIINTVHDSSVWELIPEEEEFFREATELSHTKLVIDYMKKVYDIDFDVPLEVEFSIGKYWGKEETENAK